MIVKKIDNNTIAIAILLTGSDAMHGAMACSDGALSDRHRLNKGSNNHSTKSHKDNTQAVLYLQKYLSLVSFISFLTGW